MKNESLLLDEWWFDPETNVMVVWTKGGDLKSQIQDLYNYTQIITFAAIDASL